jgi:hypothetical protein
MEYKRLSGLDNQYPTIANYKAGTVDNTSVLFGNYADINKIDFTFPSLKNLKWVKATTFRFILIISKDSTDANPLLYTSEKFYNDLISSMNEENPYFSQAAFNSSYVVQFFTNDITKSFSNINDLAKKDAVLMYRNTFMFTDETIDYESLIAYIDWVVSKVDPLDTDNGGTLLSTLLGVWDYLAIDPITNVVSNTVTKIPTTAISGNTNSSSLASIAENSSNIVGNSQSAASVLANIQSLAGKIPKTLPTLPSLPHIPNVTDIKGMLPSLPPVPKLPAIPKKPKIPSLKLPPVPKFIPKVPKVPKKLIKGLSGLKGAIAGAASAGAGAIAAADKAKAAADSAKAVADKAKAAADSAKSAATSFVDNAKNNLPKI